MAFSWQLSELMRLTWPEAQAWLDTAERLQPQYED